VTTKEKVELIVARLRQINPAALSPELGNIVQDFQAIRGVADLVGVKIPADPLSLILPDDAVDLDIALDKVIALLIDLRGDDLPPFDCTLYGESIAAEFFSSCQS
jgi:hypothetical protein